MYKRFSGLSAGSGLFFLALATLFFPGFDPPRSMAQTCSALAAGPAQKAAIAPNTPTVAPEPLGIDLAVLKGLAPVSILASTYAGAAALGANYTVTGSVATGAIRQPTLLPFPEQQQQALRDVFITQSNLAELADGLGTTLGAAYLARAHYIDRSHCTDLSQAVADVIAYANATTGTHANAGKYLFANATTDGTTPVAPETLAILKAINGQTDVF